ncbi:MAG: archaellin/type IV pilin N-terminal domain-containing protein, partial [Methanomassiliicoccales archaeon]
MWKMRKDKSAVSPVIATILMVAITVVLAAVLYVMVMGFGGGSSS